MRRRKAARAHNSGGAQDVAVDATIEEADVVSSPKTPGAVVAHVLPLRSGSASSVGPSFVGKNMIADDLAVQIAIDTWRADLESQTMQAGSGNDSAGASALHVPAHGPPPAKKGTSHEGVKSCLTKRFRFSGGGC